MVRLFLPYTVKVNHIPLSVKEHQLDSLFDKHGSCEIHLRHQHGQNEQYAFVNYASQEAARTAARELHGTTLSGGRLTVKLQGDLESSTRSSVGEYTVKVENLSKTTTEDTLEELFGFFENVEVASIKLNTPANSPFNYAYVNYYNAEDAQRAVEELNNTKIEGSTVKVKLHQSQGGIHSPFPVSPMDRGEHPSLSRQPYPSVSHSLYSRPLPSPTGGTHSDSVPSSSNTIKVTIQGHLIGEDLEMIFSQFGTITSKPSIIPGAPNFAYINFSSPDVAKAALCMNRQLIKGVPIGVKLKTDSRGSGGSMVSSSSHDYLQVHCEQLIVQLITSPDMLPYKLQLQGIESSLSVKVMPMKGGRGFSISGNQKNLDEAKLQLEVVISQVKEEFDEESFTLPCHYVPVWGNPEMMKLVAKIEQKHYVEFRVYDSSTQQPVDTSIFSQFVSAQLKSHTQTPTKITTISKFLSPPTKSEHNIWEWQDDDGSFKAYDIEQCKTFDLKFQSNPTCTFSCLITMQLGVTEYLIDFKAMTQTNVSTLNSRRIQRRPVEADHEWLFTDDESKLVPYTKQQSREIEKAWVSGSKNLSMVINRHRYKLNLIQMKQVNISTLKERKITRKSSSSRHVNFRVHGWKKNLKHAVADIQSELDKNVVKSSVDLPPDSEGEFHSSLCELANSYLVSASISDDTVHVEGVQGYMEKVMIIIREEKLSFERKLLAQKSAITGSSTSRCVPIPKYWEIQHDKITLKSVPRGSEEWAEIEKLMHASLPSARIQTLQRIQNQWLWEKYSFSKERMHEQNKGVINEKRLFHGTSSTPPEKIFRSSQGFDFRYCTRGMWGTGTYFAVNASYSDNYTFSSAGSKQLILAKVLTGETYRSSPDSSLKKPPVKKHTPSSGTFVDELYDSVSGLANGSDIFIIYDHEKAYPDYLITYTTSASYLY